jgi:hypothetical protein
VFGVKFMFELLILLPLALFGGLLLDGATNDDGDPSARADVEGTAGADLLDGTDESETIAAFGGDDLVNGFGGNDDIQAGAGSDVAEGQDGDDTIAGEAGNDTVGGGLGADSLVGGDGDDAVFGDEGNDTLSGDAGKDLILGGTGDDSLDGGAGDDIVVGQDGNDTAHLGAGNDQFSGAGASETVPDTGNDLVFGDDGNHTIVAPARRYLMRFMVVTAMTSFSVMMGIGTLAGRGQTALCWNWTAKMLVISGSGSMTLCQGSIRW